MQPLPIVCLEVGGVKADAAALDALARLALRLRRCGYQLKLGHPSLELLGLIELAGLTDVLPVDGGATEG
jgi:ABC-type transporter Mla MlaB component